MVPRYARGTMPKIFSKEPLTACTGLLLRAIVLRDMSDVISEDTRKALADMRRDIIATHDTFFRVSLLLQQYRDEKKISQEVYNNFMQLMRHVAATNNDCIPDLASKIRWFKRISEPIEDPTGNNWAAYFGEHPGARKP